MRDSACSFRNIKNKQARRLYNPSKLCKISGSHLNGYHLFIWNGAKTDVRRANKPPGEMEGSQA